MATATATTTKALKSFGLTCPSCGEGESILIDLNDLAGSVQCGNCQEEFTVAVAVRKMSDQLARWRAVEKWLSLAGACLATPETDGE